MALAALAPLIGSLAGGSLATSIAGGALGDLGLGAGLTGLFAGTGGQLLGSALGSGVGTTIATGDIGKGIESGLLGYGLGGAMNSFGGGANAGVSADNVMAGGNPTAAQLAGTTDAAGSAGTTAATTAPTSAAVGGAQVIPQGMSLRGISAQGVPFYQADAIPKASMLSGLSQYLPAATVATPGLSIAGEALQPAPPVSPTYTSPGLTPYQKRSYQAPPAGYQPGHGPEPIYFTPQTYSTGGQIMRETAMNMSPQQIMSQQLSSQYMAPASSYAMGGPVMNRTQSIDSRGLGFLNHQAMRQGMPMGGGAAPKMPSMAGNPTSFKMAMGGGVPSMMDAMGGGGDMAVPPVAGDGSSDSIPATIDGQAPALLSSDEHVIPSDVVSHLGNGSSAAGHKALRSMVHRVRKAKTGSPSMPNRINPSMMMPA